MKRILPVAVLLVLVGCGESATTYTCDINTQANDLALATEGGQSFPKGTKSAKITLENNVMVIPLLGMDGYRSNLLKEVDIDNESKSLQKGDLLYEDQGVIEAFLVNKKQAIVMHSGKWIQEFYNCK
ncbi:hypothetical protein [Providencia sp. PROV148]|uniref:hypothetical protein n=1 Tax=Providencia sp. PROV148 TaxID=2949858 RepID=UPI00234BC9F5|nr:hypothetical protein [Providencia sp. PROV148]